MSKGTVDIATLVTSGMNKAVIAEAKRESAELRKYMSPKGSLNLPALLEERRWEHGLVDDLFSVDALFSRIFLSQLDPTMYDGGTYGDSGLHMTQVAAAREGKEAPRGIIVSAGLDALDYLVSHGMDLGHIVMFCQEAPYGIHVGTVLGRQKKLIILDVGDLVGSEDVAIARKSGELRIELDHDNKHKHVDREGEAWSPMQMKGPRPAEGF